MIEGWLVQTLPPAESLSCILEQDTLSTLSQHDRKSVDWGVKNQTKQTKYTKYTDVDKGLSLKFMSLAPLDTCTSAQAFNTFPHERSC